ncbi:sushi, von Willebrand factor type A, EGF and pentraxin domain-containing protein 1-like, partial [Planococcus citri]|uniref:sushi, von Willebrand factor type A, EGF and pentraxin domain-containing protein 1-like n=2 Tax=Planococcus citri TaxID=170843 RepID=UPI0031F86A80
IRISHVTPFVECFVLDRECEELASPSFGRVTLRGLLFSDKANYTCELGYTLVGPKQRTCQADGTWSGNTPTCKQSSFCTKPPVIGNARHNARPEQNAFDVDETIQYQCTTGYVTNGFPAAKCLAVEGTASWFGPDISCEPRTCGTPHEISNGWHTGDCFTFNCRVNYHCEEGYELVGRPERTCQSDGLWTPKELPSCVPVQCPTPENPLFGTAIFTSTSYNSVVSYECKYGYMLVGERTRRCGADKKWTAATPKCQEINCGPPGILHNGWMENLEAGTGLGASIIFRCDDGMLMVGNASTVCQNDGKWRYPPPLCLAPCIVPKVQHGRLVVSIDDSGYESEHNSSATAVKPSLIEISIVKHATQVFVECDNRYESSNNTIPVVCNNGTWSYIPKCQPARCKHLPKTPENGMIIAPKMEHGTKARFKCLDGYTILGNKTTECKYGNWSSEVPLCVEKYCPYPGTIDNGKILLVGSMGNYDYRPYVKKVINDRQVVYECDKGYVLEGGPVGATCVDGHWRPQKLPKCIHGKHPSIKVSRSIHEDELQQFLNETFSQTVQRIRRALSGQNSQVNVMRTKTQTSTKEGKEKNTGIGGRSRNRGFDSDYDIDTKDYDDPELMANRTDIEPTESRKGRKGKKKFRRKTPCPLLSDEPYLHVEIVKVGKNPNITYYHGTLIRVICARGYKLNIGTNNTAKCVRGRWKPEKPDCDIIPCRVPHSAFGVYKRYSVQGLSPEDSLITEETDFIDGDTVNFTCGPGFNIKGPSSFTCILGEWDVPIMPDCTPAPCELPAIVHGQYLSGYRSGLTIANGSFVNYQCDHEFVKITSVPTECFRGELLPKKPACRRDPTLYTSGSDILRSTELGSMDLLSGLRGSCGPPARIQGSLIFRNGEPISETERRIFFSFPDGTEVTFHCIDNVVLGQKLTWRIICADGSWIGRSLSCDAEDLIETNVIIKDNSTCTNRNTEPNVATFLDDERIVESVTEFPAGTVLTFRCVDIGKYAMEGSNKRQCSNGEWDGEKPVCFGLNQENAYALEKPPTILFRHESGPIAQSNDGKLIVYPGTVLHMECLWIRRFGTPKWNVSQSYREYPQGWTTDPNRDNQLEYRLSIYHAVQDDSGLFSCITPTRHTHSVEIVVKAVHCPAVPSKKGLIMSTKDTKMNTEVQFSCSNGNALSGEDFVVCLPSGNWSAIIPTCETVQCPELNNLTDANLRVAVLNRIVGGQAMFSCIQGYGLHGPIHSTCLQNGSWSQPFPTCSEVFCDWSGYLTHGYTLSQRKKYKPREIIQFNCQPNYVLDGQYEIECQENGQWSSPIPLCIQACSYPGTVISGRMSYVKFYYTIGEVITFTCEEGLVLQGSAVLHCLPNGKWSNTIPACIPADSIRYNITHARN